MSENQDATACFHRSHARLNTSKQKIFDWCDWVLREREALIVEVSSLKGELSLAKDPDTDCKALDDALQEAREEVTRLGEQLAAMRAQNTELIEQLATAKGTTEEALANRSIGELLGVGSYPKIRYGEKSQSAGTASSHAGEFEKGPIN